MARPKIRKGWCKNDFKDTDFKYLNDLGMWECAKCSHMVTELTDTRGKDTSGIVHKIKTTRGKKTMAKTAEGTLDDQVRLIVREEVEKSMPEILPTILAGMFSGALGSTAKKARGPNKKTGKRLGRPPADPTETE